MSDQYEGIQIGNQAYSVVGVQWNKEAQMADVIYTDGAKTFHAQAWGVSRREVGDAIRERVLMCGEAMMDADTAIQRRGE